MAVVHVAGTRSNLASQVLTDLGTSAQQSLRTSGDVEVANLAISGTTGTVSGAVLTYNTFVDDTDADGGVVDHIRFQTSGASEVYRANASGDGIVLSSTTIGAGDTVQCPSMTYTAPA